MSFLSAFYSKSDHKAFIQPNLRDSGYIWLAWCREMLHQGGMESKSKKEKKNTGEEREILIWYNMRKKANSNQSHGDDAKETCEVKVDELKISRDREV